MSFRTPCTSTRGSAFWSPLAPVRQLSGPPMAGAERPLAAAPSGPQLFQLCPYAPPPWAACLPSPPTHRYTLGITPTPVHRWAVPGLPPGVELYIKRDDLTGMQLSGNKVRKLEFLLAAATAAGHDCVVTIGGVQSNHARATAVAAKYLGLDCHLILRTSAAAVDSDPGLVGNLLVERMVGAHLHMVTKEEYGRVGSVALGEALAAELVAAGRRPYVVPVGGSNGVGSWGYVEGVRELEGQVQGLGLTDIVMACGSGGTTAGVALGVHLAALPLRVTGYGVCDDPAYFVRYVDSLLAQMGATPDVIGASAEQLFRCVQARGSGYAISRSEELAVVRDVALATGVVLDLVYTGKALAALLAEMREDPASWEGRRVLFLHTGGLLGMYEKEPQLAPLLEGLGRAQRMRVPSP